MQVEDFQIDEGPGCKSPLFYISMEEGGQIITNPYKTDFEAKDAEKRSSCLKEDFTIVPHIYEERKVSNA